MKITIEPKALKWMEEAFHLQRGSAIRFMVRYGGQSTIQPGFSLTLALQQPTNVAANCEIGGITFFIREDDEWYFDGHDLHVVYLNSEDGVDYQVQ